MSTEARLITVGGVKVEVVRKAIKNLHLGVYPPDGRVRVAAPLKFGDEAVRLAVVTRMSWIKRQAAKFEGQARQSARRYVSGETHYFLGHAYRLRLVELVGPGRVKRKSPRSIDLFVPPGSDLKQREGVYLRWCRAELRERAAPLIDKWSKVIGVTPSAWGIRRMKTKWGSCNIDAKRVWLNLELIKKPPHCLEYVIVHELTHFRERHHSAHFVAQMDKLMPRWRLVREELNREALPVER